MRALTGKRPVNYPSASTNANIAAIELGLQSLRSAPAPAEPRTQPHHTVLPAPLPRTVFHNEPALTTCSCGCTLQCFGEEIRELLDYAQGVCTAKRRAWQVASCAPCQHLAQAPAPSHIIQKGRPTAGLLTQVLMVKYADPRLFLAKSGSSNAPAWH